MVWAELYTDRTHPTTSKFVVQCHPCRDIVDKEFLTVSSA